MAGPPGLAPGTKLNSYGPDCKRYLLQAVISVRSTIYGGYAIAPQELAANGSLHIAQYPH
jgi:hypothetical protein